MNDWFKSLLYMCLQLSTDSSLHSMCVFSYRLIEVSILVTLKILRKNKNILRACL